MVSPDFRIVYIHGTFGGDPGDPWYGAWCRRGHGSATYLVAGDREPVGRLVPFPFLTGPTAVQAGINGGFFQMSAPYAPLGYVGDNTGGLPPGPLGWKGNPIGFKRWGWGYKTSAHGGYSIVMRDREVLDAHGNAVYIPTETVEKQPSGFSAICCLLDQGIPKPLSEQPGQIQSSLSGWDARTCVGVGSAGVFLIVVDGDDENNTGWNWDQMQSFFQTGLPTYMRETFPGALTSFADALCLDGGGSTSFKYESGGEEHELHFHFEEDNAEDGGRPVRSYLHAWAEEH